VARRGPSDDNGRSDAGTEDERHNAEHAEGSPLDERGQVVVVGLLRVRVLALTEQLFRRSRPRVEVERLLDQSGSLTNAAAANTPRRRYKLVAARSPRPARSWTTPPLDSLRSSAASSRTYPMRRNPARFGVWTATTTNSEETRYVPG